MLCSCVETDWNDRCNCGKCHFVYGNGFCGNDKKDDNQYCTKHTKKL